MASEDLDRQDRLERVRAGSRLAEEMATMDPEDLFRSPHIRTIIGASAFSAGGIDLPLIMRAAEKHGNDTLHTIARTVAAVGMKNAVSLETHERYKALAERAFRGNRVPASSSE
jgi:hypothetical protein